MAFFAPSLDLHRLSLGRESFADHSPLALLGGAFYPVRVPRRANSLPASFSGLLTVTALRFTWVATTNSPEDFHLQVTIHAGHTARRGRGFPAAPSVSTRTMHGASALRALALSLKCGAA